MTIKPLADKVVVKIEEAEQTTASGIVLSASAQDPPEAGLGPDRGFCQEDLSLAPVLARIESIF